MRKRLITPTAERIRTRGEDWLNVEHAAVVEVTSEDKDFPVESAFVPGDARGWRAAAPGSQTIRLLFDHPQRLRCISLIFEEDETGRTQEFVLRWSSDVGSPLIEIVRQQWNFSPPESVREVEEYKVELYNVTVLELVIKPNISGGVARSEEHTSELQSQSNLVCRLLLEKKNHTRVEPTRAPDIETQPTVDRLQRRPFDTCPFRHLPYLDDAPTRVLAHQRQFTRGTKPRA